MSGGFFRGTSADQDTRFSNKQAKLLKSQKFAPELEHLVDIGKVKMDVMRPWIATRVTELLGFEDEVLINFIYGLLDGKEVNGKEVQISLTGFMEKNTGKFMKELWTLLLSAQSNASGVPQQFLDAKEQETRKKQEEMDRITNEIQKRREESREFEQDRLRKMASEVETKNAASKEPGKHTRVNDEKEYKKINGAGQRNREKSRSLSRSSGSRGLSISSDKSLRKRSTTQRWCRSRSPMRRRSPSPRPIRGCRSPSPRRYRRSPSPRRHRRSPSPRRYCRSPRPARRRRSPVSPVRRRSPSPVRRIRPSPMRRRSPSPVHVRSPSAGRQRSPFSVRRRSPSPVRRSPTPPKSRHQRSTTPRLRSPSPVQKVPSKNTRGRSPAPPHRRSSPYGSRSPSPVRHQELRRSSTSVRSREKRSPTGRNFKEQDIQVRSPGSSSSPDRSPVQPKSPLFRRKGSDTEDKSPYKGHVRSRRERAREGHPSPRKSRERAKEGSRSPRKSRERGPHLDKPKTSKEEEAANRSWESVDHGYRSGCKQSFTSSAVSRRKSSPPKFDYKDKDSFEMSARLRSTDASSNMKDQVLGREKSSPKGVYSEGPSRKRFPKFNEVSHFERHRGSYSEDAAESDERYLLHSKNVRHSAIAHDSVDTGRSDGKANNRNYGKGNCRNGIDTSNSENSEEREQESTENKRKSKTRRSDKHERASDDSYTDESEIEDRREAKRRRKEEKKLRKEERHRKREERLQRRRERRAEKLKSKDQSDSGSSADEYLRIKESQQTDEDTVSEQKKLEIELRRKALESLQAKKRISH